MFIRPGERRHLRAYPQLGGAQVTAGDTDDPVGRPAERICARLVPCGSRTATRQSRYAHVVPRQNNRIPTPYRRLTQKAAPHGRTEHKATNAPAHLRVRPGGDPPSRP
ncbi:hypothetical protein GCM10010512_24740 [Streptomyces thermoviolaceus subsp. thermoviolaceus]|nr:hypothetical protein GCM10010499_40720 [Streptomyces thermoviolaceus subsp. apingens]GHA92186.1 hypothetical protein GCM10010512_24740 [Streptomyces thermoviolaceus subsp. thermoviolaceus]